MSVLTYKYRIKDRRARKVLRQHAFAVNQVWNWCVAQHRDVLDRYHAGAPKRRWLSHFDLTVSCKGVGRELGLNQQTVGSVCQQWALGRSIRFRSSFGNKRALGWVPFQKQSRKIDGNAIIYRGESFRWFGNKRRPLPESAKGGAFVEDASGRWYVTFQVELDDRQHVRGGEVGIDLGLKALATTSDGQIIANPRHLRIYAHRLAAAQRAGKKKRVRAIHAKIAACRRDYHHKISRRLANDYALIVVGNVNPGRLAKTRMAKSVLDAGWSTFRKMLAYKATAYVEVDERFTTQTCSSCGSVPASSPKGIAGLGIRDWVCSSCGTSHQRDVNAAANILRLGRSAAPRGDESRIAA